MLASGRSLLSKSTPIWLAFFLLLICQFGLVSILSGTGNQIRGKTDRHSNAIRSNRSESQQLRIGILSTYPPQRCGIGEYSRDLFLYLQQLQLEEPAKFGQVEVNVIVVDDRHTPLAYTNEVKFVIKKSVLEDYLDAAIYANENLDAVVIQHEFGIFGGHYGDYLQSFVTQLRLPIHVYLHTVLKTMSMPYVRHLANLLPLTSQVSVAIPSLCNQVTDFAPGVPCSAIPHGVAILTNASPPSIPEHYRKKLQGKKILLSAGLMGEDKGITYMLQAFVEVRKVVQDLIYVIVGAQHPLDESSYVSDMKELVTTNELQDSVVFVTSYQTKEDLINWVALADVAAIPHRDMEQVSSGTLSMAMGLGVATISTGFRYAQFLCDSPHLQDPGKSTHALRKNLQPLGTRGKSGDGTNLSSIDVPWWNVTGGVGIELPEDASCWMVPKDDVAALQQAAIKIFTLPGMLQRLKKAAWDRTRSMTWPKMAARYVGFSQTLKGQQRRLLPLSGQLASTDSIWEDEARQEIWQRALAASRQWRPNTTELSTVAMGRMLQAVHPPPGASLWLFVKAISALSCRQLLFSRWIPAPSQLEVFVDNDGGFYASNGLTILHGSLAKGFISHASLEGGLTFGRGVRYGPGIVLYTDVDADEELQVNIDEVIDTWGHQQTEDFVEVWCSGPIESSNETVLGNITVRYALYQGRQAAVASWEFSNLDTSGVTNVELVTTVINLSGMHYGQRYEKFHFFTAGGKLETKVPGSSRSGAFYETIGLKNSSDTLRWFAVTGGSSGQPGLFVLPSNGAFLYEVYHKDSVHSGLYFIGAHYKFPNNSASFEVRELRLALLRTATDSIADYDPIFSNLREWSGVDFSQPEDTKVVLKGVATFEHHMVTMESSYPLRKWLTNHGWIT